MFARVQASDRCWLFLLRRVTLELLRSPVKVPFEQQYAQRNSDLGGRLGAFVLSVLIGAAASFSEDF